MRRREFMLLLGGAITARPLVVRAQPAKVYRLGILANNRGAGPSEGFLRAFRDLGNAANPALALMWREVEATAGAAGLTLHQEPVREPQEFAAAFAAIAQQQPGGLLILNDALVAQYLSQIAEFAVRERLPAVSQF